jgi:dCTP deaminase
MILSDTDILKGVENGQIIIQNFDQKRLQPASYDVLLGFDFLVFERHRFEYIDPKKPSSEFMHKVSLKTEDDFFVLHPKEFALGVVWDYIGVDGAHCCQVMGKSSLARLGLIVHTTAGFIDPGNELNITLELVNMNIVPIRLYPKMKIAQIAFEKLSSPAQKPYGHKDLGSKYYKSTKVEASQMHQNFITK